MLPVGGKQQQEAVTPTIPPRTEEPGEPGEEVEPKTKIAISQELKMTNDWTILGDYDFEIIQKGREDRIVLATSAKAQGGEMMWDDTQYWSVAVLLDDNDGDGKKDGAYNLFFARIQGQVYMEVNEAFINGLVTPMVTVYVFSGTDRQVINYIYDGEFFVENIEFTTKDFSTGGINKIYSTLPEYKPL